MGVARSLSHNHANECATAEEGCKEVSQQQSVQVCPRDRSVCLGRMGHRIADVRGEGRLRRRARGAAGVDEELRELTRLAGLDLKPEVRACRAANPAGWPTVPPHAAPQGAAFGAPHGEWVHLRRQFAVVAAWLLPRGGWRPRLPVGPLGFGRICLRRSGVDTA
jgi:hypothetical protein